MSNGQLGWHRAPDGGSGVVRESGMIAKEQGHRVLRGWGTVRILGLSVEEHLSLVPQE